MKIAIIDLGTNGFRLNIAESTAAGQYTIVLREAFELKLAADGIHRIGDAPFARGVLAMKKFAKTIESHAVDVVKAFGTAALRIASNAQAFIDAVAWETGIQIQLISGDEEARYIYEGMRHHIPLSTTPVLMIDVGGGSVECIIANADGMIWAESFNVGVAILKHQFHRHDPILPAEIAEINLFLDAELAELAKQCALHRPARPVIACGTLDFMVKILRGADKSGWDYHDLSRAQFDVFYHDWIQRSEADLEKIPNVPSDKIEMLAVSLILMDWMARLLGATVVTASAHSMKAGILQELTYYRN